MTQDQVAPPAVKIVKWFGNDLAIYDLGEKTGYSWGRCTAVDTKPTDTPEANEPADHAHTIECLWVWHDCDHHVMLDEARAAIAGGEERNLESIERFIGWSPTGVQAHTFVSALPLHIEPSVYWPSCCGMHGFIRDGKWVSA